MRRSAQGRLARTCLSVAVCLIALGLSVAPAGADFPYGTGPEYKVGPGVTPERPQRRRQRLEVRGHARGRQPATPPTRASCSACAAATSSTPTPPSTPPGRRPPAGPTSRSPCSTPASSGTTPARCSDLRRKTWLNRGELPLPDGCTAVRLQRRRRLQRERLRGRLARGPRRSAARRARPGVMTPQDLIIAFSNGNDGDSNGFVDDIAGWDFLDDDNDAYDDVQYGHGTGEAQGSTAEANNGNNAGSCPNCMFIPMRVGDSFVADANNFGQAVLYGVDNGALVIQEALGTLNNTQLGAPGGGVRLRPRRGGDRVRRRRGRAAPQLALELPAHDRRQLGHEVRRRSRRRRATSSSTAAPTSRRRSRSRFPAPAAPRTRPASAPASPA